MEGGAGWDGVVSHRRASTLPVGWLLGVGWGVVRVWVDGVCTLDRGLRSDRIEGNQVQVTQRETS